MKVNYKLVKLPEGFKYREYTNPAERLYKDYDHRRLHIVHCVLTKKIKTPGKHGEQIATWFDYIILKHVPGWKIRLLLKYNRPWLRKLLFVDIEIKSERLLANFGTKYTIMLNGKEIGSKKFSVNMPKR